MACRISPGPEAKRPAPMPSLKELMSVIDDARFAPALDPEAFPTGPDDVLWSSATFAPNPASAWVFGAFEGRITTVDPDAPAARARCVR